MKATPRDPAFVRTSNALLLAGFLLTACGVARPPSASDGPVSTAAPTLVTGPTQQPTLLSTIPDPRIIELRNRGINLANVYCYAECRGDVTPQVPLDKFIAAVGMPDKVGSSVQDPNDFVVLLIYGHKGMFVYASRPYANDYVNVTPAMRVEQVLLYKARTLEDLEIETGSPLRTAQDWSGFGPVRRLPK